MSLMVDPSLNWVFYIIAGDAWPQGDEDAMRELAREWDDVARQIAEAGNGFNRLSQRVTANVGGDVQHNFADFSRNLSTLGAEFVQRAQAQAAALREQALSVENAKYGIIIAVAVTAAEILWALSNPFTAPLVPEIFAAGRTAVTAVQRTLFQRIRSILMHIAREAAEEAAEEVAEDMLAQFIQIAQGNRHGFDWKSVGQSAALGAVGGVFAHGFGKGLGKFDNKFGTNFGKNVWGAAGNEAVTEVVVGLVGAGAFGGDLDGLGWSALNGGLSGAATHGAHHAGEALHDKATGGGKDGAGPKDIGDTGGIDKGKIGPISAPPPPAAGGSSTGTNHGAGSGHGSGSGSGSGSASGSGNGSGSGNTSGSGSGSGINSATGSGSGNSSGSGSGSGSGADSGAGAGSNSGSGSGNGSGAQSGTGSTGNSGTSTGAGTNTGTGSHSGTTNQNSAPGNSSANADGTNSGSSNQTGTPGNPSTNSGSTNQDNSPTSGGTTNQNSTPGNPSTNSGSTNQDNSPTSGGTTNQNSTPGTSSHQNTQPGSSPTTGGTNSATPNQNGTTGSSPTNAGVTNSGSTNQSNSPTNTGGTNPSTTNQNTTPTNTGGTNPSTTNQSNSSGTTTNSSQNTQSGTPSNQNSQPNTGTAKNTPPADQHSVDTGTVVAPPHTTGHGITTSTEAPNTQTQGLPGFTGQQSPSPQPVVATGQNGNTATNTGQDSDTQVSPSVKPNTSSTPQVSSAAKPATSPNPNPSPSTDTSTKAEQKTTPAPAVQGSVKGVGPKNTPQSRHTPAQAPKKNQPSTSTAGPSTTTTPPTTGGKEDFKQAQRNFSFSTVRETGIIGDLRDRNDGNRDSVGIVATVAATPGDNLTDLANKYAEGFTGDSHHGRFGLVIGINGVSSQRAEVDQAIRDFQNSWDGKFPVAVVGFTWRNPTTDVVDQKSIPYGAIRETIVRHPVTTELTQQLRDKGDADVYLHLGDADVDSFTTDNGPLFDAVDASAKNNPEGAPEIISGGYRVRPQDGTVANSAAQLDLDVRQAMASADPRSVYFPEPNTFVRMTGDKLENDATFGTKNDNTGRFDYGAKEGQGLVDSVMAQRNSSWQYSDHPTAIAKFDTGLAIRTDGTRIAGKVGTDPANVTSLTQSHANQTTWTDQVTHHLGAHTNVNPNLAPIAAKIAFHGITPGGATPGKLSGGDLLKTLSPQDRKEITTAAKSDPDARALLNLALKTRDALIDGLPHHQNAEAPPKTNTQPTSTKDGNLPGPKDWGGRRDGARPTRFVSERFDPAKSIAKQFTGNREGLKGGELDGAMQHIRYDVRRFETSPGTWVREFTVPLDLTSHSGSVSPEARAQLAADLQQHLDTTVNQRYTLPGGDQLHVTVDARPSANPGLDWYTDNSRGVPVNIHDGTVDTNTPSTNQLNWDLHDPKSGLTHEVMHFLGLGEGYQNGDLLFNRQDQPGVMGPDAWSDSSLTPENVAKIEEVSNQARLHDHPLTAQPHHSPGPDRGAPPHSPESDASRHTPASAPQYGWGDEDAEYEDDYDYQPSYGPPSWTQQPPPPPQWMHQPPPPVPSYGYQPPPSWMQQGPPPPPQWAPPPSQDYDDEPEFRHYKPGQSTQNNANYSPTPQPALPVQPPDPTRIPYGGNSASALYNVARGMNPASPSNELGEHRQLRPLDDDPFDIQTEANYRRSTTRNKKGRHHASSQLFDPQRQPIGQPSHWRSGDDNTSVGLPMHQRRNISHTEAKIIRDAVVTSRLGPGYTLRISGESEPCGSCQSLMMSFAAEHGGTIEYLYRDKNTGYDRVWSSDTHVSDPAAFEKFYGYRPASAPSRHTPAAAPTRTITVNGKTVPGEPGSVVPLTAFHPGQGTLLGTHGLEGVVAGGQEGADNFRHAVAASITRDAPKEHARITTALGNAGHLTDLGDIAEAAGVHVHVLDENGSWTSHGPETGRPVHIARADVDGKQTYLGTRENVHIGRPKVSYAGSTVLNTPEAGRKVVHRGEFEVETVKGEHYVRLYTSVLTPAGRSSEYKDVHQDPDGTVVPFSGEKASGDAKIFWVGGGRPLRAVQWTAKYEHDVHRAPGMTPVLRSFLVPLDTFTKVSERATVEVQAKGNSLSMNVDQNGDVNQFGLRGDDFDALQKDALKGSLVTYIKGGNETQMPDVAGRHEDISDLYARLGLDENFDSEGLGRDLDPWFDWKPDGRKYFRNDPQALRGLAKNLSNHYHTWKQSPEAFFTPHGDSIPDAKGGNDNPNRDRVEEMNVFLNTRGPGKDTLTQLGDGIGRAIRDAAGTDPIPVGANELKDAVLGGAKETLKLPHQLLIEATRTGDPNTEPRRDTLANIRAAMTDVPAKIAKSVSDGVFARLDTDLGSDVRSTPFGPQLETAVQQIVADRVEQLNGGWGDHLDQLPQGKRGYLSGKRGEEFTRQVAKDLSDDKNLKKLLGNSGLTLDPDAFAREITAQAVPKALHPVAKTDLVGKDSDALREHFKGKQDEIATALGKELTRKNAGKLVAPKFRKDFADAVVPHVRDEQLLDGLPFTGVDHADADAFMNKLPDYATQAEIGAAIATDERRIKADFNTRETELNPQQDDVLGRPFANDFGHWRDNHEIGYTQKHDPQKFQRHQDIGRVLATTIADQLDAPHERSGKTIVDRLVSDVDSGVADPHDRLARKFAETVKPNGRPDRAPGETKPNTFSEHAQMVVNQYLKLAQHHSEADRFVSRDAIVKAILFHDMEKVNSKNQFGDAQVSHDREPEHRGAVSRMNDHEGLWATKRDFEIARAMVDSDPFGFYFRDKGVSKEDVHRFVTDLAHKAKRADGNAPTAVDVRNLFTEFHQYYQADFSSYSAQAKFVNDTTGDVQDGYDKLTGVAVVDGEHVPVPGEHRFAYTDTRESGKPSYEEKYQELAKLFDDAVEAEQNGSVLVQDDDRTPFRDRLPEFARDGRALGSVVPVDVRGADDVGREIETLLGHLADGTPEGIDAITGSLNSGGFESFLGDGRASMVRVGQKWFEVRVQARPDLGNAGDATLAETPATGDVGNQNQVSHTDPNADTATGSVGTSAFFLFPAGPYVSAGGSAQLAAPSIEHTSTTTGTEQRVIRSAGDLQRADVGVTYRITVTTATGSLTGSEVDGRVGLLLSTDLAGMKPHEQQGPAPEPKPDWAEQIEFLTPEAVRLDENALFDQVSKALHPSVTKFGAPGRTTLREFVSGVGVRQVLGSALSGSPIVSNDLVSPHGSYREAVQLQATPTNVELVGVVPGDSELRLTDSSVAGGSTSAASKSGFDVNGTFGGGAYVPGAVSGVAGVTGSASAKITQTSQSGTSVTAKTNLNAKGEIGLYKVTADVSVTTSSGETVTVPATAYVRMGLPEAKAQGLPVPDGTRDKVTAGEQRFEPPYLAAATAAGHVRAGSFTPAAKVQPLVENALRERPGFAKFLPRFDKLQRDISKGSGWDTAERLSNLRKITAAFSPGALRSKMDSLLGPGVSVQLKQRGLFTDEYISVTVKAKLSPGRHLGKAEGRSVKGSVASSPTLSSSTTTEKGWSVGVEGRVMIPSATPLASMGLGPTVTPVQYSDTKTWKNSGGPTVTTTTGIGGSPDAQVFEHDVEFEVEISTYTRNRPWVKRLTPGSPLRVTPRITSQKLPKISGKVDLWVSDGSTLKTDPADFAPGKAGVVAMNRGTAPSLDDLLAGPRPDAPKFLHVEAVANTEALRDEALRQLERAADGDGVLGLPGGEARKRIDRMFTPEAFRAGLPRFLKQGARSGGFRYERRVADRVGGLGMNVSLSNPKLVVTSDAGGSDTTFAGGGKAGFEQSRKQAVEGNVQFGLTARPAGSDAHGQGQLFTSAKWSPWVKTSGTSTELGASVDHVRRAPSESRTVLVQYDADVRLVAETRQESVVNGSKSRAGADVKLPGSVFVRMTEDQARSQGLLPAVEPRTPAPGTLTTPALVGGTSSALGAAVVEDAPDLSKLVRDTRTALGRTGNRLLPKSVLDDSMNNLQRMLDAASPESVTSLVDSALDGGVPLVLHDPGVVTTDSYQVLLKARITDTSFVDVVHDGGEVDHAVSSTTTGKSNAGHGSSYGGQVRLGGRGLFSDSKAKVSGFSGVAKGVSATRAKSDQTVATGTKTSSATSSSSGPAVRYRANVTFDLVVERSGRTFPVTSQDTTMVVRAAADDQKIGAPGSHDHRATTSNVGTDGLKAWQDGGYGTLPPSAMTEGLRGAAEVRAAAVTALRQAGARDGLIEGGATLRSAVTNEVLQANLPSMLDKPLEVPDLHEAALLRNGHGSVKVYARLVNPTLAGLSDSVKMEHSATATATFTGEAKVSPSAEQTHNLGGGGVSDPAKNSHSWGGLDVRSPDARADQSSSATGAQRSVTGKPKGRTGLVGFDVEYRVVADLGGGRTAAVEVRVPSSALVRMTDADLETFLKTKLPDPLATAQDAVKQASEDWRTAEKAVDTAQREADDRWLSGRRADPRGDDITRLDDVSNQALTLAAGAEPGSADHRRMLALYHETQQQIADIRTARQVAEARRDADEARQKWWDAKGKLDDEVKAFNERPGEHVEASDTGTGLPYDFDVSQIQVRPVTDRSGKVVAVSFLPVSEHTADIERDWADDHADTVGSLPEGATPEAIKPLIEAARGGAKPELNGRKYGEWTSEDAAPWTDDTLFVMAHGRPESVKLTLLSGETVRVDGAAFAKIVAASAPFAQAGKRPSVTLIACSTGQLDGPGGVAHDFQRTLAELGGPLTVHAPTKPALFGRNTATVGQAVGAAKGFTTVTDGGRFATFGAAPLTSGLSFLDPAETAKVRDWLARTSGENLIVEADPAEMKAFADGRSTALRGRGPGEGGILVRTPWAEDLKQGKTFLVTGHGEETRAKVFINGRESFVDGATLAGIVLASPEFQAARPESVTLFQCAAGRRRGPGGLAYDFHAALAELGGPPVVYAATDSVLANPGGDGEPSAPLFGATDDAFTAVVRGGHWETFGRPADIDALTEELADAFAKDWRYGGVDSRPGPVALSDRAGTLALAREAVQSDDPEAVVARHERPEVVQAVVDRHRISAEAGELARAVLVADDEGAPLPTIRVSGTGAAAVAKQLAGQLGKALGDRRDVLARVPVKIRSSAGGVTISFLGKEVRLGRTYHQELALLQLHGVTDRLMDAPGTLHDLAAAVGRGLDVGRAADAVEVLDRHGALSALLAVPGGRALTAVAFDGILRSGDPETFAREVAEAVRSLSTVDASADVVEEAIRGTVAGWDGDEVGLRGTVRERLKATRQALWLMKHFRVTNLAWLYRWRIAAAVRRYQEHEKAASEQQARLLAEVTGVEAAHGR